MSLPRVIISENSPSLTRTSSRASSPGPTEMLIVETSQPEPAPNKHLDMEISTFKFMKEKVRKDNGNSTQ